MINDLFILDTFTKNGIIIAHKIKKNYIFNNYSDDVINYLRLRYNDISDDIFTFKEVVWRILYNIDIRPCCICGMPLKFIGKVSWDKCGRTLHGYNKYCSTKCANNDKNKIEKQKQTCYNNYGVENPLLSSIIQEKIKLTCLLRYGEISASKVTTIKEKIKQTCLLRYGVTSYSLTTEFLNKTYNTNILRYGVGNPMLNDTVKRKLINTCLLRYGVTNGGASSAAVQTYIKNSSYNKSVPEDLLYELFLDMFGINDVKRLYMSEEYPYKADFYICSKKLYIEYHGSMFHNYKRYTATIENNEELKILQNKSKGLNNRYNKVILLWTIDDVIKLNKAIYNNINILIIYPYWHKNWLKYCNNKNKVIYKDNIYNKLYEITKIFNDIHKLLIIGEIDK